MENTIIEKSIYNVNNITSNSGNSSVNSFDITPNVLNDENYKTITFEEELKTINNSFNPNIIGVPNWNYEDFLHERLRFLFRGVGENVFYSQKGFLKELDYNRFNNKPLTLTDGVGYFFYKVFFNFYTSHGLLGGLVPVSPNGEYCTPINTALQYLYNNANSTRFSTEYQGILYSKYNSLIKFGQLLNYLSFECPWYFKDIGGLQEAVRLDFDDLMKERKITMSFNPDAIDFRVSALFELYLDACFDSYNHREIVPSNLRKFDMSILVCQMPIDGVTQNVDKKTQYFSKLNNGDTIYPCEINVSDFTGQKNSKLAFKWILLQNCEFDYKNISSVPDSVNNENPFNIEYTVDVTFTKAYVRDYNYALGLQNVFSTLIL